MRPEVLSHFRTQRSGGPQEPPAVCHPTHTHTHQHSTILHLPTTTKRNCLQSSLNSSWAVLMFAVRIVLMLAGVKSLFTASKQLWVQKMLRFAFTQPGAHQRARRDVRHASVPPPQEHATRLRIAEVTSHQIQALGVFLCVSPPAVIICCRSHAVTVPRLCAGALALRLTESRGGARSRTLY